MASTTQKIKGFTFDESIDESTGKKRHDYMLDGKPLTGVTTILKVVGKGDALVQWSANKAIEHIEKNIGYAENSEDIHKLCEEAKYAWKTSRDTAGDFGTNVHKAIEEWVKEGKMFPDLTEKEQKSFDNFREWAKENDVNFVQSEMRIYSRKYWYAGTLDLLIEVDGKLFLADIKTSSRIYPEHMWQMGGYDIAVNEMTKNKYKDIEGYVVVNLKKTGTIDWKKSYDREGNKEAFLACHTIYRQKLELDSALGKRTQKSYKISHTSQKNNKKL